MLLSLFLALAASAESLDGRWIQDCRSGYQREEIFSGNKATYTERNFWDKSCTDLAVETISRGTIRLGKPALRPEGAEDIEIGRAHV